MGREDTLKDNQVKADKAWASTLSTPGQGQVHGQSPPTLNPFALNFLNHGLILSGSIPGVSQSTPLFDLDAAYHLPLPMNQKMLIGNTFLTNLLTLSIQRARGHPPFSFLSKPTQDWIINSAWPELMTFHLSLLGLPSFSYQSFFVENLTGVNLR